VKIGFKFQSLGKISNILAADPPVLLGQFQHWPNLLPSTCSRTDWMTTSLEMDSFQVHHLQVTSK